MRVVRVHIRALHRHPVDRSQGRRSRPPAARRHESRDRLWRRSRCYGAAFAAAGAELIHIVDLDGAIAGAPRNLDAVRAIRDRGATAASTSSGGLRTLDSISAVIDAGADIVSIGSAAFLNPALLTQACVQISGPHLRLARRARRQARHQGLGRDQRAHRRRGGRPLPRGGRSPP